MCCKVIEEFPWTNPIVLLERCLCLYQFLFLKKKKKKDASNAVAPATAKFIPSQILIPLPFLIPRYGCTNGSPGDSASH